MGSPFLIVYNEWSLYFGAINLELKLYCRSTDYVDNITKLGSGLEELPSGQYHNLSQLLNK